jgi:hypothetical protein
MAAPIAWVMAIGPAARSASSTTDAAVSLRVVMSGVRFRSPSSIRRRR